MNALKQRIVRDYEKQTGTHDEPDRYARPLGDPGLIGPGSVSWEIHSDPAALAIAAYAAITMEILHPSVMAGVAQFSNYREEPAKRARNTGGYVIVTTFGGTDAANRVISRVRRMHERVNGTRPDGVPYRAMDPELIGWVHTCIPWAVMRAFERYNRPLTPAERDRYLAEQSVIGRAGGADEIPVTAAELADYMEEMRPRLAVTTQTLEFFEFLLEPPRELTLPTPVASAVQALQVHAAMTIMPEWAQRMTGFHHSRFTRALALEPQLHLAARTLRWAFGIPPFRAMADARVSASARSMPRAA